MPAAFPHPALVRAREHYARLAWADARDEFCGADHVEPLGSNDLWRLATSAGLSGSESLQLAIFERIYQENSESDSEASLQAARAAFWLSFRLAIMGEGSRASGWQARAERLVTRVGRECVEQGYLLLTEVRRHVMAGDYVAGTRIASEIEQIGARFGELDLCVFARNLRGRALIRQGQLRA